MDPLLLTILIFGMLLFLLAIGVPLVFCFGMTAITFIALQWGMPALYQVAITAFGEWTSFLLLAAPLFVLMANILERSGVAEDLYDMMYMWLGGIRGGLAIGTVAICAIFAAMSGISAVATVTMGLIALPSMIKRNYDPKMAVGSVAAGGTLGILIPPSVIMILYGALTGASVGKLFVAGLIPGLLLAVLFMAYIAVVCFFKPELGPPVPLEERFTWKEKLKSTKGAILPVSLIFMVLGLIYMGVATPTEAAGLGAFGSFVVLIINKRFSWAIVKEALEKTCRLSGMVLWILLGAKCFSQVYTALGASDLILNIFSNLELNRWVILIGMQIVLIIMGMFMDPGGIIMICTPIFVPLAQSLGFDLIWFGILFTINMELGYITPPFGFNLFYMKNLASPLGIDMTTIYRSVVPFVVLDIVGLLLIMLFPDISIWLVGQMK